MNDGAKTGTGVQRSESGSERMSGEGSKPSTGLPEAGRSGACEDEGKEFSGLIEEDE